LDFFILVSLATTIWQSLTADVFVFLKAEPAEQKFQKIELLLATGHLF
jgi:hypothetical protein